MLNSQSWSTTPAAPAIRVDFPNGTPGYRKIVRSNENPDEQISTIHTYRKIPLAAPDKDFIWIQVPGAPADTADIYFPVDGRQPTTQEAEVWSCATINDPKITNWYIEAFSGAIASTASTISGTEVAAINLLQIDVTTTLAPSRIIVADMVPDLNKQFWQKFRNVADTVEGRKLLYSILIEIRRINGTGKPCYTSGIERITRTDLLVKDYNKTRFANDLGIVFFCQSSDVSDLRMALERYYEYLITIPISYTASSDEAVERFLQIVQLSKRSQVIEIPALQEETVEQKHIRQREECEQSISVLEDTDSIYQAFKKNLESIAQNKIGHFVLVSIINELIQRGHTVNYKYFLKTAIGKNQTFETVWNNARDECTIMFANTPVQNYVIGLKEEETATEPSPGEVAFFHEILHWGRRLISWKLMVPKNKENTLSFFHPIFTDHPAYQSWLKQIKDNFEQYVQAKGVGTDMLEMLKNYKNCKTSFPAISSFISEGNHMIPLGCLTEKSDTDQQKAGIIASLGIDKDILFLQEKDNSDEENFSEEDCVNAVQTVLKIPLLNIEEVRNIIGGYDPDDPTAENTNLEKAMLYHICENGYRLEYNKLKDVSQQLHLRYGHVKNFPCKIYNGMLEWCEVRALKCLTAIDKLKGG